MRIRGLVISLFLLLSTYSVHSLIIDRVKRQTVVGSQSQANGTGDQVETDSMAYHYKNTDGLIGMNVSSGGNSTGANQAQIDNTAFGMVGDTMLNATGNVLSQGQESSSHSDIQAALQSNGNKAVQSFQQGSASGTGDTQTQLAGGSIMSVNGQISPESSKQNIATAGATGSLGSKSDILSTQILTWDTLFAQLVGSAVAEGTGHAQANTDLGAGDANNGVEMNGVVSGIQTGGGNVNAQVNGNANMNGTHHDLTGNMYGRVNGTSGNSTLVGATHIQSNTTTNTSVSSFGDSKIGTDGTSAIDLSSKTDLDNQVGANGDVLMNGTATGKNHSMTVQNGLKVKDNNGETLAIGNGGVEGKGSENSNAAITVNTNYTKDGEANIVVKGDGSAVGSNNNNSSLSMNAHGDLANTNGVNNNSTALANGAASGEMSNMTGNVFIGMDGSGSNGNAMMEGWGGGKGNSSVNTNTGLLLNDGGQLRNMTVNGGVSASGDKTSVHSIAVVTDYAGQQSLSNYQHASSSAAGASSASASNFGVLKRKKRSNLGVLYDILF